MTAWKSQVHSQSKEIELLHKKACEEGKSTYRDPQTGKRVMTESFLIERGYCCDSNCRHCPYLKKQIKNLKIL